MSEPRGDHVLHIVNKLARLSPMPSERCIYRVHDHLRKEKESAYEPDVVAIGPYHHGKNKLQPMEEHKLRYLKQLLKRRNEGVERYVVVVQELEEKARKFYAEPISHLDSNKFVEMMLLDSCFIIELLRKRVMPNLKEKDDPIFQFEHLQYSLVRDLLLFENQLPFFVLKHFFNMTENAGSLGNIVDMSVTLFGLITPSNLLVLPFENPRESHIKHLLGLLHYRCCDKFHSMVSKKNVEVKDKSPKSAIELQETGIKFKKSERRNLFDIRYENGTMEIPILDVEDNTESFLRNLIAYEQYLPDTSSNYFTAYMHLMDELISSSKDVQILSQHGIIRNFLGDNKAVSIMFNELGNNITVSMTCFSEVYNAVNKHCKGRCNVWLAILRRDYFNTAWALISFLAAVVLLYSLWHKLCFHFYLWIDLARST